MKIQFASNWVCRFEPPIEKRKIMEKQLLPSELLSERSYTMVAIRMTWVISILLLSLHCLLAEADDRIEVKTPVEVLSETLVSLNLANPSADLEANLSKGDRRFIGINGYTCTTPGANNKEYSLVHSAQYGLRCLAGTSDNIESEHHKALIEEATDYARKYNTELLRRIHTGKI